VVCGRRLACDIVNKLTLFSRQVIKVGEFFFVVDFAIQ
jgi:hypothetical protein